jgi:hypothetical protein
MSAPVLTEEKLKSAVAVAVASAPPGAMPGDVAERAVTHPSIAKALEPISRFRSETLQGIVIAGVGWFLQVTGLGETTTIVLELFGYDPDPAKVSTVLTTILTIGGLGWAWIGRETTTRPLA